MKNMFTQEELDFMKRYVEFRYELIVTGAVIFDEDDIKICNIFDKILNEMEDKNETN